MIIADLFVYTVYNFLTRKFGRNNDDAKFSSILLLSAFVSFLIIDIIISLGIVYNNILSQIFHKGEVLSYIIIGVIVAIFFCIKYYKYTNMKEIEERLATINTCNLKIMKIIVVLFVFIILICFFILCYVK
jgi:multisubunit Na+/H+ antiporter MnhF subunit